MDGDCWIQGPAHLIVARAGIAIETHPQWRVRAEARKWFEKKSARQPIRVSGAIRHYYFANHSIWKLPSRKFCRNDCAMLCDVVRSCASVPRVDVFGDRPRIAP